MKKLALFLALTVPAFGQGTVPPVNIGGSIGITGGLPLAGTITLSSMTDANYTLHSNEWWAGQLIVPSSLTLTATRTITAPSTGGQFYNSLCNHSGGGFAVTFLPGAISVPNGTACVSVVFDATTGNYVQVGSSGGGGSGTVNSGTAGQYAKYAATGNAVSGGNLASGDITAALGYTPAAGAPLPTTNLLAQYNYTEVSGSVLTDYSGNGNNGTITVAPTTQNGIGYYMGTSSNIDLPSALNATNTYYFLVNFPPASFGSTIAYLPTILASSQPGGTTASMEIFGTAPVGANGGGFLGLLLLDATDTTLTQPADFFAGTHVITLVCPSGSPGVFYIDGQPSAVYTTATQSCNARQTGGHFRFGTSGWNTSWTPNPITYYGSLFYSSVHSAATVAQVTAALLNIGRSKGVPFYPVPYSSPTKYAFFTGDSITCGTGLTGGSSICGTGTVASNAYPGLIAGGGYTTNTYAVRNFGIPGAYVQQQIASAPYSYAPLCTTTQGQSIGSLFEGTNNFLTAGVTAGQIFFLQASWINLLRSAGCRAILIDMISRGGVDGGGTVTLDADKDLLNTTMRNGWGNTGAVGLVDLGADPHIGCDGCYNNATYILGDHTHPTAAGQVVIANAVACIVNAVDGSSPQHLNPIKIVASSYTTNCGDGGIIADASSSEVDITLNSALWQTGRIITICNNTITGTYSVLLHAPSDYPFGNVTGATLITLPNNSCDQFQSTYNGNNTTPGDYWAIVSPSGGGGGGGGTTNTIASGTAVLNPGALATQTCATVVSVTATGVLSTDSFSANINQNPTSLTGFQPLTTGGVQIWPYPTANAVNFEECNPTASTLTPTSVTVNWRVVR